MQKIRVNNTVFLQYVISIASYVIRYDYLCCGLFIRGKLNYVVKLLCKNRLFAFCHSREACPRESGERESKLDFVALSACGGLLYLWYWLGHTIGGHSHRRSVY